MFTGNLNKFDFAAKGRDKKPVFELSEEKKSYVDDNILKQIEEYEKNYIKIYRNSERHMEDLEYNKYYLTVQLIKKKAFEKKMLLAEKKIKEVKEELLNSSLEEIKKSLESLGSMPYFKRRVVLEIAVQNGVLNSGDLISIVCNDLDDYSKFAAIEAMKSFQAEEDLRNCLAFIADFYSHNLDININDDILRDVRVKNPVTEEESDYLFSKYKNNEQEYELDPFYSYLKSAGIRLLKDCMPLSEDYICKAILDREQNTKKMHDEIAAKHSRAEDDEEDEYEEDLRPDGYEHDINEVMEDDFYWEDSDGKSYSNEDYTDNSHLLGILAEHGGKKSVEFAIELLKKDANESLVYKNELVRIFQDIDLKHSSSLLLRLMKGEDINAAKYANSILRRLEFGRIGISNEGVEYLERVYDLGECNNPDYHAKRLTPNGEIGIFDEELKLIKYFHLNELSEEDEVIKAELLDFVYGTLFYEKPDETPEERAERIKYLEEFKGNYYRIAEDRIFESTGVRLNNLSFKEQGWFIIYFNKANAEQKNKIKNFVETYGENGIKCFMSCETGMEMGEHILKIGEMLSKYPVMAKKIFMEYARVIDKAENGVEVIDNLYREMFSGKKLDRNAALMAILKKAFALLENASLRLSDCAEKDKKDVTNELIFNLKREEKTQNNVLNDLLQVANGLNDQYQAALKDVVELEKMFFNFDFKNDPNNEEAMKQVLARTTSQYYSNKFNANRLNILLRFCNEANSNKEVFRSKFRKRNYEFIKNDLLKMGRNMDDINMVFEELMNNYLDNIERIIPTLNDLMHLQNNFENQINQIICNNDGQLDKESENHVSNAIFQKYNELIKLANQAAKKKIITLLAGKRKLSDGDLDEIVDRLILKANNFLSDQAKKIASGEKFSEDDIKKEIEKINGKILLLDQIVKQLPREEVSDLDLRQIAEIDRIENLPAKDLLEKPELLEKVLTIIDVQFPSGDREAFLEECRNNKNLSLTITLANNEILCLYGREKRAKNIFYLDWFMANPDAPIKGLGEATSKLEFINEANKGNLYYAVAKPHVKSFELLLEKFGFVSFGGSTEDGEYKHHYARCRRVPEDAGLAAKNLSRESEAELRKTLHHLCRNENETQALIFGGRIIKAARVAYGGLSHADDITKEGPRGWIFNEIERQYGEGFVLSRFIPETNDKDNRDFYAIFEKNPAQNKDEDEIWQAAGHQAWSDGSEAQATSKKALSI